MPFTLAHPVVILPIQKLFKNKLSATGLIIGSIIPDFEYLINIVERSVISHTLEGILYFNVPVAVIITFCWHGFVKQILVPQLPSTVQKIFYPHTNANWFLYLKANIHIYFFSLLVGIFFHLVWDSFSNSNGFFVVNYTFLHHPVFFETLPLYRISWWASTIIGMYFIWVHLRGLGTKGFSSTKNIHKNFWPLVYVLSCAFLFWEWRPFIKPMEPRYLLVAVTGAALISIIIISFILKMKSILKE